MPVDRPPQIGLELGAQRVPMHGIEDRVAIAARRLRTIHRDVRIPDELVAAAMLGRADGDADAHAGEHFLSVDRQRHGHRFQKALGDSHRVARVEDVFQQHGEFIPADAGQAVLGLVVAGPVFWSRDRVVMPQHSGEPARGLEQEPVAGGMADVSLTVLNRSRSMNSKGESVVVNALSDDPLQAVHEERPAGSCVGDRESVVSRRCWRRRLALIC